MPSTVVGRRVQLFSSVYCITNSSQQYAGVYDGNISWKLLGIIGLCDRL